jgi:hypothetical protein
LPSGIVDSILEIDGDLAVGNANREAGNREPIGMLRIESGADVEGPAVGPADDDAALERAFAQRKARVRAGVLHGVDFIAYAIEADGDLAHTNAQSAIRRDVAEMRDTDVGQSVCPFRT